MFPMNPPQNNYIQSIASPAPHPSIVGGEEQTTPVGNPVEDTSVSQQELSPEEQYLLQKSLQDVTSILTQDPPFDTRDCEQLQKSLNILRRLQEEGKLDFNANGSFEIIVEALSNAYLGVTGGSFITDDGNPTNDFNILPHQLDALVNKEVRVGGRFASTTVSDVAQQVKLANIPATEIPEEEWDEVSGANARLQLEIDYLAQEIEDLNILIASLDKENKDLNDLIAQSQTLIKTLTPLQTSLQGNIPNYATHPYEFAALFNTRDLLQNHLNALTSQGVSQNDPTYVALKEILDSFYAALPLDKYPAGTTATVSTIHTYALKTSYIGAVRNSDPWLHWLFEKELNDRAFVDNFVKFVNGDPTATQPMSSTGYPIDDSLIQELKKYMFNVSGTTQTINITQPNGTPINPSDAFQALSQMLGQGGVNDAIDSVIAAHQAIINTSQSTIISNQANIEASQAAIFTKQAEIAALMQQQLENLDKIIDENPGLADAIDKLIGGDKTEGKKSFSINRLIALLIQLCQTLQEMATAEAARLSNVTQKMNAYSTMLTQVPILLKSENKDKDPTAYNQLFANAQESIRANKSMEEDLAKEIQNLLQSLKDASQAIQDFIGTMLNMFAGISQKIHR